MYRIKNSYLTVQIEEKGAELWSVKDSKGVEYLWGGDSRYWSGRAPNLFPYIARLTDGTYILDGKSYKMDIHGFAKDMTYEVEQISDRSINFWIHDTEETREQYPYHFRFGVGYKLEDNVLDVTFTIWNDDSKIMYFGVGAHPGFRVPLESKEEFTDYYLEFKSEKRTKRVVFSEDCFVTDELESFPLEEGKRLALNHQLFDHDAIVLQDMAKSVALMTKQGKQVIQVSYPNMTYLGLWQAPGTDAPYLCIEPWSSLPSRKGIIEDLKKQQNLIKLEAGNKYQNQISIGIGNSTLNGSLSTPGKPFDKVQRK